MPWYVFLLNEGIAEYGGIQWNINSEGRIIGYAPIRLTVDPSICNPEARMLAERALLQKGAKLCKEFGLSHSQRVYKLKNKYYTWDNTKHKGGEFKVMVRKNGQLERIGTVDKNLKKISK